MSASYDRSTFYGIDTQSTREGASQMQGNADDLGAMVQDIGALLADVLWISEVQAEVEGDARFPGFAASQFHEVGRQSFAASESNEFAFDVVEYRPA